MSLYIAHYKSPGGSNPVSGVFDFESEHRLGSKQNMNDARMTMLEKYGRPAVTWNIDSIEAKRARDERLDDQLELDFREAYQPRKHHTVQRGIK